MYRIEEAAQYRKISPHFETQKLMFVELGTESLHMVFSLGE